MVKFAPELVRLEDQIRKAQLPADLAEKVMGMLDRLERIFQSGGYSTEFESTARYIDWVANLPWNKLTKDILDLAAAKKIFDKNHHGLGEIKERILEYLSVLTLKGDQQKSSAPIICLVGLVGTGKTTFGYSIAEALGRKFIRVPFGGLGSAATLRGQSRMLPDAEPGQIIKALRRAGSCNPVILLDELDRVTEESRADIAGVLVELLDPEQNVAFVDHYIDFPFDLTQVLFVATANNTTNIATAVLDRCEIIQMPSYTDEEKIVIGRDYLFPKILKSSGLNSSQVKIDPVVWPKIVRPLGFDAGMRSLERTIEGICLKVAKKIVEGKADKFVLTADNIKDFLPAW